MIAGKRSLSIALLFLTINAFSQKPTKNQQDIQLLADNVFNLSEVMLHDVASPVAAARFYAYSVLAAYETVHLATGKLPNINEKLNVNPEIKPPAVPVHFDVSFAANYAMLQVGRNIMPSGATLEEKQKDLIAFFKKKKSFPRPTFRITFDMPRKSRSM